ncbi:mannose-1-phosphate guanylyltransferase/mannose-6-phosphate isomerase [bacterium]|nr:mannose-1-phosphate guanylyltransferase/mannose-6-phosphate isomerase [bacterium]
MTSVYCIIMAGGSGSRLWPVSREMFPKQMFKIDGDNTLFQRTFLNISNFIDDKNIVTATNIKYVSAIKEQLKILQNKFSRKNEYKIVSEPISRNTAPCIALAVKYINDNLNHSNNSPIILTVPSDQLITDRIKFSEIISKGIKLAEAGYIVTYGTETTEINENFGYIKARKGPKVSEIEPDALKTVKFVEKPVTKEQKDELKGKFYMNAGLFMFSAKTFFNELQKHEPAIYNILKGKTIKDEIPSIPLSDFEQMPDISVDYAIMEYSKKIVTVPLNTGWKDIGSWNAIYDLSKKDENGNYFTGKTIDIDSKNSMVYSTSKLTATMGLKDTFVIETEDAILVSNKNALANVKTIYKQLNGQNSSKREIHKTVYRPWGFYTVLENGNGFLTKCITVNPNAKLSVQLHHHRSEHWIILEGEATVLKGDKYITLHSGESIDIGIEEIHSLQNLNTEQLKVLEVQQGDILDENDIERIEDIYGRV